MHLAKESWGTNEDESPGGCRVGGLLPFGFGADTALLHLIVNQGAWRAASSLLQWAGHSDRRDTVLREGNA